MAGIGGWLAYFSSIRYSNDVGDVGSCRFAHGVRWATGVGRSLVGLRATSRQKSPSNTGGLKYVLGVPGWLVERPGICGRYVHVRDVQCADRFRWRADLPSLADGCLRILQADPLNSKRQQGPSKHFARLESASFIMHRRTCHWRPEEVRAESERNGKCTPSYCPGHLPQAIRNFYLPAVFL